MERQTLEELYPHLFMNNAKSIVSSMLRVDEEAARIKAKTKGREEFDVNKMTIEEKQAIAFQCIENSRKQEKEKQKMDAARSKQKKNLREYDPRVGIEERHMKITEKRQERIKNNAEEKLQELRKERQRLFEEVSTGELEQIKFEIRQNAEEVRKQDLMQKKQIREIQEMEKIAKNKELLRQEMEKKQRELQEFRLNQLFKALSSFIYSKKRNFEFYAFEKINTYAITLKSKTLKLLRKHRFKKIFQFFHSWKTFTVKLKLDEEAVIFQAEQERLHYLTQIALKNYEFCLRRKALEGFAKNLYLVRTEKKEEEELKARRQKLENFMNFVKVRTEEEMNRKEKEKRLKAEEEKFLRVRKEGKRIDEERKLLKEFESNLGLKGFQQDEDFNREQGVREFRNEQGLRGFKDEKSPGNDFNEQGLKLLDVSESVNLVPYRQNQGAYKQDACTFTESEAEALNNPKAPDHLPNIERREENPPISTPEIQKKTPKISKEVTKMQQRQEERKLKREALDAKYREKKEKEDQAKKEQEQKAIEEEKKKKRELIEKKKLAERLKKEQELKKKQDLEELKIKNEIAEDHFQVLIQKKTFFKWQEFHFTWQRNLIKAEVFHDRAIKKFGLDLLYQAFQLSKKESALIEAKREERAYNHYLHALKRLKFDSWVKFLSIKFETYENAYKVRLNYLKRMVLGKWNEIVPELLDERYEREKYEDEKVERFRVNVLGPKVIRAWKDYVEQVQEEKLKEQYANAMWEKAQEWLSEPKSP